MSSYLERIIADSRRRLPSLESKISNIPARSDDTLPVLFESQFDHGNLNRDNLNGELKASSNLMSEMASAQNKSDVLRPSLPAERELFTSAAKPVLRDQIDSAIAAPSDPQAQPTLSNAKTSQPATEPLAMNAKPTQPIEMATSKPEIPDEPKNLALHEQKKATAEMSQLASSEPARVSAKRINTPSASSGNNRELSDASDFSTPKNNSARREIVLPVTTPNAQRSRITQTIIEKTAATKAPPAPQLHIGQLQITVQEESRKPVKPKKRRKTESDSRLLIRSI